MGTCCNDPTEPSKLDPRELVREQMRYDELLRDLFTENPEKVIIKQLNQASVYLRELAAFRAYYPSVRFHAIKLLEQKSIAVLNQIIAKEPDSEFGQVARQRLEQLR